LEKEEGTPGKNPTSEAHQSRGPSSTTERDSRDFYPTPEWCVHAIYDAFPSLPRPTLEPCAGVGSLISPLKDRGWAPPRGIELDPPLVVEAGGLVEQGDGLALSWTGHHVLMNPPYRAAQEWIEKGLEEAQSMVALLRLGFLASKRRKPLLERHPPYALGVLSKRPSFRHGRTDSSEYAWFIWTRWQGSADMRIKWLVPPI